ARLHRPERGGFCAGRHHSNPPLPAGAGQAELHTDPEGLAMRRFLLSTAALTLLAAGAASANDIPGDPIFDARPRYESVDQDGLPENANALTLRTRLGYETPDWHGLKLLVEGENVTALVEDYNSSTNGKLRYPVVPDPETTELNRLQISFTGDKGEAVVGR